MGWSSPADVSLSVGWCRHGFADEIGTTRDGVSAVAVGVVGRARGRGPGPLALYVAVEAKPLQPRCSTLQRPRRLNPNPPNTTSRTTIRMIQPVVLMTPPSFSRVRLNLQGLRIRRRLHRLIRPSQPEEPRFGGFIHRAGIVSMPQLVDRPRPRSPHARRSLAGFDAGWPRRSVAEADWSL